MLKRARLKSDGAVHVFDRGDGKPLCPRWVSVELWRRVLEAAGLRPALRWHDLRHTYATLLIGQGEPIKVVQGALGHATVQMTLDRYAHLLPDAGQDLAARLEELVRNA
jgi:integrase